MLSTAAWAEQWHQRWTPSCLLQHTRLPSTTLFNILGAWPMHPVRWMPLLGTELPTVPFEFS